MVVLGWTRRVAAFTIWLAPLLATGLASGQAPTEIAYDGTLTVNGSAVSEAGASLTFRLFSVETGGTAVWTETQTGIAVVAGRFSVHLGSVSTLSSVTFDGSMWLETEYQGEALTPRYLLSSQAYARRASSAAAAPWTGVTSVPSGLADGVDATATRGACNPAVLLNLEYGPAVSQSIYVSNPGSTTGNVSATAVDNQGNSYDLGVLGSVSGRRVKKLSQLVSSKLGEAGFATGFVTLGITVAVDEFYVTAWNSFSGDRVEVPVLCL